MKAAIGNTLVLSIIVTFLSVVLLILISSIVYTKAFRIKNRIVDEIEKAETYNSNVDSSLNTLFREFGYKANSLMNNSKCTRYGDSETLQNTSSAYHYCVFKMNSSKNNGYYYKVVAFAYLDFPFISDIQVPVYGETKMFYE